VNSQVNPLGKGHCNRCGSEFVKAEMVSAARDKTGCFYGDISAGNQLTREKNTHSSLLIWKSQLEKLKADVDQAFSRVCEGLLEFGPGFKPNVNGRKRKNKLKKKKRLRWVQKDLKPNAYVLKDSVVLPVEGLSPAKGIGGSDKSPVTLEISGGLGFLSSCTLAPRSQLAVCSSSSERGSRPDFVEVLLEGETGPFEKMGLSSKLPEVAGGPPFALGSPCTSNRFSLFGYEFPKDLVVSISRDSVDVPTVWAGSGPLYSLVPSSLPSSDPTLTHTPSFGSGLRNGMELALIPEEEPGPLFFLVRSLQGVFERRF